MLSSFWCAARAYVTNAASPPATKHFKTAPNPRTAYPQHNHLNQSENQIESNNRHGESLQRHINIF